ncbi:TPA: hypothetical protein ACYEUF_002398 [Klebsiella pneumoniae]
MTTDITELAQSLKAAANTTADAIDRLKAFPGDELIDLSQHEGDQVDIDITTLNEWYELSSPANILALVEALEKAQQRISQLESRTVTVKLPDIMPPEAAPAHYWGSGESMAYADGYNKSAADLKTYFAQACSFAGVNVEFE